MPPAELTVAGRPPTLPALTGLRFFAAFAVLVYHFAYHVDVPWWGPLHNIANYGYLGVPLFFILSGFVLAYNYFPQARGKRFSRRGFWTARFARIYPLYALVLAPGALGVYLRDAHAMNAGLLPWRAFWETGITELTMQQNWLEFPLHLVRSWNPVGWTLSQEAYFYAVFPALLGLALLSNRRAAFGAGLLGVLAAINYPGLYGHRDALGPFTFLALFVFGMLLARVHELELAKRWQPALSWMAAVAALAVMAGLVSSEPLIEGICTALFGLLILGLAGNRGFLPRALSVRPLVALGEASYALYIIQMPLTLYLAHFWVVLHRMHQVPEAWTTSSNAYLLFCCLVSIPLSLAAHYWFERPARAWVQQRLAPRPAAAISAGAASGR